MRCSGKLLLVALLVAVALPASAQIVVVGSGSAVSLGDGRLDLGCGDLVVHGSLMAGSGAIDQADDVTIAASGSIAAESSTLNVGGDFVNEGGFAAGTSHVVMVDDCGRSVVSLAGGTTFYDLSLLSTTGKRIEFEAGETTTVLGGLTLAGTNGALLQIRSSVASVLSFLVSNGPSSASHVDVDDNDASGGNPIILGPDSTVGSNAPGWTSALPVPLSTWPGLFVLVLGLASLAVGAMRGALGLGR